MILPDTSVWIDHLRSSDPRLIDLLANDRILCHPFVRGEIALGSVANRERVIARLGALPQLRAATPAEVHVLIDAHQLWGCGIGYVDAHLLAAVRMTAGVRLWSRDKRLHAAAERLEVALTP